MSHFKDFESTFDPPENCERPSDKVIQQYEKLLPVELLDHWRDVGWCSYGQGLLWLVNPQEFDGVVEEWVDFESGPPLVFLRTAFAHLYYWHDGYVFSLDVQYGSLSQVTQDVKLMFTLLCDPELQERILRRGLYQEAKQRLGPPNRDECFAFVPALALGGPGTAETVQRVKIREHLSFLAQVAGG